MVEDKDLRWHSYSGPPGIERRWSTRHRRWEYSSRMDLGRDEAGKRQRSRSEAFATVKEAVQARRKALTARDEGRAVMRSEMTLYELLDLWLEDAKGRMRERPHTWDDYARETRNHLQGAPLPANYRGNARQRAERERAAALARPLAATPVQKLTWQQIRRFLLDKVEDDGRGATVARHSRVYLNLALEFAVDGLGVLAANPMTGKRLDASPRKRQRASGGEEGDPAKVLTPAQLAALLAEADAGYNARWTSATLMVDYGALFDLAAHTGMRVGELFALAWADVDLERREIKVHRTTVGGASSKLRISRYPKTEKSYRTIQIDPEYVEMLRLYRKAQDAYLGTGNRDRLVFCDWRDGGLLYDSTVNRYMKRASIRAGVPYVGMHGLRHTMASHWLAARVDLPAVSARLGHANVAITAERYVHFVPVDQTANLAKVRDYGRAG